ncbi:MAG: hypothetical protein GYB31_04195 [Bacteroidetes bacterium]|nr:hypothetical protein [Bacteroidota bacterium]
MSQIIDTDPDRDEALAEKSERQKALVKKSVVYFVVMGIAGSLLHTLQTGINFPYSFAGAIGFIGVCMFLSVLLELVRSFFRKRKEKKTEEVKAVDPFWFQVVEGGFALWILFAVLSLLGMFFLS